MRASPEEEEGEEGFEEEEEGGEEEEGEEEGESGMGALGGIGGELIDKLWGWGGAAEEAAEAMVGRAAAAVKGELQAREKRARKASLPPSVSPNSNEYPSLIRRHTTSFLRSPVSPSEGRLARGARAGGT